MFLEIERLVGWPTAHVMGPGHITLLTSCQPSAPTSIHVRYLPVPRISLITQKRTCWPTATPSSAPLLVFCTPSAAANDCETPSSRSRDARQDAAHRCAAPPARPLESGQSMTEAFVGWVICAAFLSLCAIVLGMRAIHRGWLGILIDQRGRFSLTQVQLVLWTIVILSLIGGA